MIKGNMELNENQENQNAQEIFERSDQALNEALDLLLDIGDTNETLKTDDTAETHNTQENLRNYSMDEGGKQVSFGKTVEVRCKEHELENAILDGNKTAAEHRAEELADMLKEEQKKKNTN